MNQLIKHLINFLITQVVSLIPSEWREEAISKAANLVSNFAKDKLDELLDWLEDLVIESSNKLDDNLLPVFLTLRSIAGVPDFDIEKEENYPGLTEAEPVEFVGDYPSAFKTMKAKLYVIHNENVYRVFPGFAFMGYLGRDTYYGKKR